MMEKTTAYIYIYIIHLYIYILYKYIYIYINRIELSIPKLILYVRKPSKTVSLKRPTTCGLVVVSHDFT